MLRPLVLGAVLAASIGVSTVSAGPPAADQALLSVRPGAPVKEAGGGFIGAVRKVGWTDSGRIAVVMQVDGRPVTVAARMLALNGDTVISTLTKAQIKTAARLMNG